MDNKFTNTYTLILELEQLGLVKRTFRRLDPERQQVVVTAMLEEAADAGPLDLNIKRVAERSGVSVGSLYQYFGSRENLLAFAIELVVRSTVALFNEARPLLAQMPLREGLSAYLQGGMEWTAAQRGAARFFARAAYQGDAGLSEKVVAPIAAVMLDMVRDMLTAAQDRGELRPGLDLEAAARVVNTVLIAVGDAQLLPYLNQYYLLTGETVTAQKAVEMVFSLLEHGLFLDLTHENSLSNS